MWEDMWIDFFVEEPLKKGMGLVRGYVIPCERRHAKRHVLGERMCEFYVEESLKEGMVCVGRYVNFLWKSL